MDAARKERLKDAREAIVRDLEVIFVLEDLVRHGVLSQDDVDRITLEKCNEDRTRVLVDIIEGQKDNATYDQFADVLNPSYPWLYESLKVHDEKDLQNFENAIILGDLPRLPSHYIERKDVLKNLRSNLRALRRGGRIVLHGMTGSGKSCLAAAAVRDKNLLKEEFNYQLFWFNLGETKTDEQILKHLQRFAQRLTSNIDLNIPPSSNSSANISIEVMKDYLKKTIASSATCNKALLILDNICSDRIIPAFDIGCKMIITTQHQDFVRQDQNTIFVPITTGFTEEETLLLFAKSLDTSIEKLQAIPEAKRVSDLCKGQPMLIDLIGTAFKPYKEDLLSNGNRWDYYIGLLTKKQELNLHSFSIGSPSMGGYGLEFNQIFSAIKLCMKDLEIGLRDKYFDFVVFVEDINIMPEVLQIFWECPVVFDVQNIMTILEKKSLIVSYYNQDRRTYIYGIHDLLLAYLKQNLSQSDIEDRHKKVIETYKKVCANNFADLPNDNYIYQYIGHHLIGAKMFDVFRDIYFDLNFIGAKIRATGIADLIKDFDLYESHITNNERNLIEKLQEYRKFIEANGQDLHKHQDLDIIQCGLQQKRDSSIYKEALVCATQRLNKLYFKIQPTQDNHFFTHSLDVQEELYAACFTELTNEILVGSKSGKINHWEQTYSQKLCTFEGHTGGIKYLELSPCKLEFLSVSEDGSVKLWYLNNYTSNRNSNGFTFNENDQIIPSPRLKQAGHQAFFGNNNSIDRSRTFRVDEVEDRLVSASFSNFYEDSRRIVIGTQLGRVEICNVNTKEIVAMHTNLEDQPCTCVMFSFCDELVIVARAQYISLYSAENGEFISKFNNKAVIKSLLVVPNIEHCLIAVNEHSITVWNWDLGEGLCVANPAITELYRCEGNSSLICGAVTEDGEYLVVASTDHYTRMWHLKSKTMVEKFQNKDGLVISLDAFYENNNNSVHILLSGSDDRIVKQLHVFPEIINKKETKYLDIYGTYSEGSSVIAAIANSNNKIQILKNRNQVAETAVLSGKVTQIAFSNVSRVVYGLQSGKVHSFDAETNETLPLLDLQSPIILLRCFANTTVACSQNGYVQMYPQKYSLDLNQYCPKMLTQIPTSPILEVFCITKLNKLLLVLRDKTVVLLQLSDGTSRVLIPGKETVVTSVALAVHKDMLAFTMTGGVFEVYNLSVDNGVLIAEFAQSNNRLGGAFSTCAISNDKKYLALGRVTGNIEIWNLETKYIFTTLYLHKVSMKHLNFLPGIDCILVSVSEQIAWWDLNKVPIEAQNKSKSMRRRSNSVKKVKNITLSIESGQPHDKWSYRSGEKKKPHLLSAIKFHGLVANTVAYSKDLTRFFTVDNSGEMYVMELLE